MPTYYTPPTPVASSSPSYLTTSSRSSSYSPIDSASSSSSSNNRSKLSRLQPGKGAEDKAKKSIPYLFLGSIVGASLLAHKYWPKGFPHGDKEDWELSELGRRARQRRLAEKAARRGKGAGGGAEEHDGYRGRSRSRSRGPDRRWLRGESRERGNECRQCRQCRQCVISCRGRSRSRDRPGQIRKRSLSRERTDFLTTTERYYHPGPEKYRLERSASITGTSPASSTGSPYSLGRSASSAASRFPSPSQGQYYEYDELPSDIVYVYRDSRPRSRPASLGAGGVRQRDDGLVWRCR
ncbi:hypothetical protein C8A03DRAFT_32358 [Achaetomium macrosporum]|uniref:Uncharacterized protein n=1 Tax=Achaetomium macrosporum TaxID=79813 RepID=A0AAN7H851_9PEZI|nr:hypothetical protein C8A03DRAFT_32358 [Achaetomium macrosporum]